jgi:cysteine desulfuration protein SufE
MAEYPPKLRKLLGRIGGIADRQERIQLLIDVSKRYRRVSEAIARPPYGDEHKVPACESEAYVFPVPNDDGSLTFHFAVDNPQGISAMAMAAILGDTLSGVPLDQVAAVPTDLVYDLFGNELSMGKNMGLMGMVGMVTGYARERLAGAA